jgi:hypothetical protein
MPMTCTEARQHWGAYLDGEGGPELRLRIRGHLADCPVCAEWFARQERVEQALAARLAAGAPTPGLWERALDHALVARPRRRRRLVLAGALAAAAALLLALWLGFGRRPSAPAPELARDAGDLHERWLRGDVRPDFQSTSDLEVDRYLKQKAPFPVHCPPRTDVAFDVQGAGLCTVPEGQRAAYIVGQVERAPVSILVLDRASLAAFPRDRDHLAGGRRHRCREGAYAMVAAVVADNVVVVTGAAPPEALEKLLDAYGTYPEG